MRCILLWMVIAVIIMLKWLKKTKTKQYSSQNGALMPTMLCHLGCNVPAIFQKVVTKTFKPYLNKFM